MLLGLYLLLFVWLFSISGMVLNHGKWPFADFWLARAEQTSLQPITRPAATGDLAIAQDLMRQLGISGEVNRTERNVAGDEFSFQVIRPGRTTDVDANLAGGSAGLKDVRVNAWGIMSSLHHFTGVSMDDPDRGRDWWLTRVWSLAMDAVAFGLIILVASGLYLWWRLEKRRARGLAILTFGTISCVFFLFGLGFW